LQIADIPTKVVMHPSHQFLVIKLMFIDRHQFEGDVNKKLSCPPYYIY